MINNLTPYGETKDAGAPWINRVPEHWEVVRSRYLFREIDRRSAAGTETHLSMSQKLGLVPSNEVDQKTLVAETYIGAKLVEPLDLVLNRLKAHLGVFAIADRAGLVSPDYSVFRPADGANVRFFEYVLRSSACRAELRTRAKGIVEGFWRLYTPDFYQIRLPVPPIEEQQLIVRFLDAHSALTARLIRAKSRLIKLLEEQKQAITQRAVTRGLDPNVRIKPSGVPWLGDIPERWDVVHLRYLVCCLDGQRVPLNGTQRRTMQGPFPYWGANRIIDHVNSWLFDEELVLLGEDGAPFFEAGRDVSFAVSGKIWVNNHTHVLKCKPRVTSSFLATTLNCVDFRNFIDGSTRDKLTQQAMGSIPIQVPEILEQRRIVDQVDRETSGLRNALRVLHGEISLIRELWSGVVADVVTGKLDVRAAAAALPEITETEAIDEPIDGEAVEEAIEDVENEAVAA